VSHFEDAADFIETVCSLAGESESVVRSFGPELGLGLPAHTFEVVASGGVSLVEDFLSLMSFNPSFSLVRLRFLALTAHSDSPVEGLPAFPGALGSGVSPPSLNSALSASSC